MTSVTKIILSLATLLMLSIAPIQRSHAQTKPPGYWVALVDVTDEKNFYKEFPQLSAKVVIDHGGKILVRAVPETLQGSPTKRLVIFQFPDVDTARATYHSSDFQDALKIGERNAKLQILIAPGETPR